MTIRVTSTLRRMMLAAAALPAMAWSEDVVAESARLVDDSIRSEVLMRVELDLAGGSTQVWTGTTPTLDDDLGSDLARWGGTHPSVLSYLVAADDGAPRRVSDVVPPSQWRATPAYAEVFRDRGGRHQLSLVTRLEGTRGSGWVLLRDGSDFSEEDVEVASLLLPQLTVLDELASRLPREPSPAEPLTPREGEVLQLLATGASAAQIARELGVSPATVRKHLEHLYAKLGAHDRMSAVLQGRALLPSGLVVPRRALIDDEPTGGG